MYTRGLGWRMHCGVEVTESSTNKQHHLLKLWGPLGARMFLIGPGDRVDFFFNSRRTSTFSSETPVFLQSRNCRLMGRAKRRGKA